MLDYRIITFLKLCETMNYHIAGDELHMTQPSVTNHIKSLEQEYACKFFIYNNKKLYMTKEAFILKDYAMAAYYNDLELRNNLNKSNKTTIKMGATKTIGDFVVKDNIVNFLKNENYEFSLIVDNTEHLLKSLDNNKLDFALIEGLFDKNKYGYKLYSTEKFVGICSKNHPFANKSIKIQDIFNESIIVREVGSGTRAIFEKELEKQNYSLKNFKKVTSISSFELIKSLVIENNAISFVYDIISKSDENICSFEIDGIHIMKDFNYVFLKNTNAKNLINIFERK
ncbi:LysR substrate-binding domain-containing protein [Fusobacterium sp. MFO224]|uniref:LysR substrate-binding domain-containing protein n=1 Tax=Fusobacterium sp. MFO224 TaxID=3378070 RepID=UPI003852F017